jgi:hypothetical protein
MVNLKAGQSCGKSFNPALNYRAFIQAFSKLVTQVTPAFFFESSVFVV